MSPLIAIRLNALGLFAVSAVLLAAFADQLIYRDLPCPLCILQRVGFVAVGLGLALNLRFGPHPSHYGMMILSAACGGAVSVRQILLHIVPGTGTYGDAVLGFHFYTWAAIVAALVVVGSAVMLLFDRQFERDERVGGPLSGLGLAAFSVAALLALANGISTVLECGGGLCPENPTSYLFPR
jgi:disulfide bond formation protein DsbB